MNSIISKYNLTKGQEEAFRSMVLFLNSPDKTFTLSGLAGVGKSFVLRLLIDYYNKRKEGQEKSFDDVFEEAQGTSVLGLTISHKAKNILAKSIPNSYTIASGLGMKMHYDNKGDIVFRVEENRRKAPPIRHADLIIIDECSMVTKYIFNSVIEYSKPNAKIISVGDHHQCPAIDSSRTPNEDSVTFSVKNRFELTEIIRQEKGNPILELADKVIKSIDTNHDVSFLKSIKPDYNKETGKGIIISNREGAIKSLTNYVKSQYDINQEDNINTFYIAYRNATVRNVNLSVRNAVFSNPKERFLPRDRVVAMSTYYKNQSPIIHNSEIYTIEKVRKGKYNNVHVYFLTLKNVDLEIPIVSEDGIDDYNREKNYLTNEAKRDRTKWKAYYKFIESFGSVDYAYCITIYKSQGSTYDTAYVDVSDIMGVRALTNKEKLQSVYVGITRAKNRICLI